MLFYKLLKKPFFGNFMVRWRNPLTETQQQAWQPVSVRSQSGGTLVGLFAMAQTDSPKATIVCGHPMGKEAKGYFLKNGYTDLLLEHGYHVLIFDINGFGESSHGNFFYFHDIVAIGQKAKTLTPNLPIGYHGISLGGQWATIAFADEAHCFDFAIVESAATTLAEFWVHFPVAHRTLGVFNALFPKIKRKISMIDRIKEARGLKSILWIYSHADVWTPVAMGERYIKNCPIPSELWTVQDAKHAMMMKSSHQAAYQEKLIAYFDRAVSPV